MSSLHCWAFAWLNDCANATRLTLRTFKHKKRKVSIDSISTCATAGTRSMTFSRPRQIAYELLEFEYATTFKFRFLWGIFRIVDLSLIQIMDVSLSAISTKYFMRWKMKWYIQWGEAKLNGDISSFTECKYLVHCKNEKERQKKKKKKVS